MEKNVDLSAIKRLVVRCEDGIERRFHQAGIHTLHGYVYADHRRVYGLREVFTDSDRSWAYTPPLFIATGKHARATQPERALASV